MNYSYAVANEFRLIVSMLLNGFQAVSTVSTSKRKTEVRSLLKLLAQIPSTSCMI